MNVRNLALACLLAFLLTGPLQATTVLFDGFNGNGLGTGDGSSINGGFVPLGSNHFPNSSTVTENLSGSGFAAFVPDPARLDAGIAIFSQNGFDVEGATITWEISDANLFDANSGDVGGMGQIGMGVADANANYFEVGGGLRIHLTDGGQYLRVELGDTSGVDPYVQGSSALSGWDGTSPLTVQATLDADGFEINLSSTATVFTGQWDTPLSGARGQTFLQQVQDTGGLSYVWFENLGPNPTSANLDAIFVDDGLNSNLNNGIPEPSSYLLWSLFGFFTLRFRRRVA